MKHPHLTHACCLPVKKGYEEDSRLWAWGEGGKGQLGVGDVIDRAYPVEVKVCCHSLRCVPNSTQLGAR